jgi:hypothetical protein
LNNGSAYTTTITTVSGLTSTGTIDSNIFTSGGTNLNQLFTQQAFKTISSLGQSDVVADQIHDTLTLSGINIDIITNPSTDTITFSAGTGGGTVTSVDNVGAGAGIFRDITGTTINLKSLTSTGGTVFITNNNDEINLEVQHTVDTNTFVTGFTYNGINQHTITLNNGSAYTTTMNTFSATTISADTFYGDGSNLTGITTTDNYVTGTTKEGNAAVVRRDDNTAVLTLSGGSNVTIVSGGTNLMRVDVSVPADTNTFVTGGTIGADGQLVLEKNNGIDVQDIDFTTTKRLVITADQSLAISAGRSYLLNSGV